MIVFRGDEHLALAGQAPPRPRVLHPVEIALEAETIRIGRFGSGTLPRSTWTSSPRREIRRERVFTLRSSDDPPTDQGRDACVRAPYHWFNQLRLPAADPRHLFHATIQPHGYDTYAVAPGPAAPRAACAAARRAIGTRYGEHDT